MFPTSLPSAELSRLSSTLPPLLKAFALKLGFCDTSPIAKTLMYLVHRYRQQITEALLKFFAFEETLESTSVPCASDVMSLEGLMSLWERKEHESDPIPQVTTPADRDGEPLDYYNWNDEDEFPELREYREVLINSPAYSWLASTLAAELQYETIGEDHRSKISQAVVNMLDTQEYTISRKLALPSVEMRFHTSWNMKSFFGYQNYDIPPREALPRALVLTGIGNNLQASTFAEYMSQVWPYYGPKILKLYQNMIAEENAGLFRCVMPDDTRIEVLPSRGWNAEDRVFGEVVFTVTGAVSSVAEIGQIIAWINAALSLSDLQTGIRVSCPVLEPEPKSGKSIRPGTNIVADCKIYSTLGVEGHADIGTRNFASANCWSDILGNTIYVRGYPTARRAEHHTGMEVSLGTMIALANSRRLSRFKGFFSIKGFCSIILPTRLQGNFIYWHLVTNLDGKYISYTNDKVRRLWREYPPGLSTENLQTSRHILGWCDNIQNLAGSEVAKYDIGWSGLGHPRAGCAFDKVSITGGQFVTGGVTALIGRRDKAVHIHSRDDYVMRLKWIAKKFAVFYDLRDRRAWLLNGASALLHLVRASLRHDKNDPFKDLFLFDESSVREPSDPFTGKNASIRFLTDKVNTSLPIYAKPTESKEEETTTDAGAPAKISSSTRRNYSLKDRIEDIYEILEQIMTHQADVFSQDGIGFRIKYTLRRQLEGFDFMDVATDEDPLWPRVTTINARGRGWMDLTRALHAISLFGTGFGELLRPSQGLHDCFGCLNNIGVPKGEDYLAVCTSDLQELIEKRGSRNTSPWRLIDEIYWYTPDKAFEQCQCKKSSAKKHDRIQVILPASIPGFWGRGFKSPRNLPAQGAVLFGHSWRFPLRWKDYGPPEEGEPQEDLEEVEASFHDSGIGSSIDSSGRNVGGSSQSVSDAELDRQQVKKNVVEKQERPPKRPFQPQSNIADAVSAATEDMSNRPTKRSKFFGRHNESAKLSQPGRLLGYPERSTISTSRP
ncbi:hypothetical protein N8I77_006317 [Diaporthe amygdali]|uniref:Uncharacterized protein n=1 Tax=Phomopsis amygdali TaxID=1214568 RepID=A0AAD9SHI6_PHOAM|nr:hypothetical protein N8I77_006317 [Diaporthe amygdali]